MNKLNLLTSLAVTPALLPGIVLTTNQDSGTNQVSSTNQDLPPRAIFEKIPDGHKIDKDIFKTIILTTINNAKTPNFSIDNKEINKLLYFYSEFNETPSLINNLFTNFKKQEPKAFYKDPTSSFIDYVADKLIKGVEVANKVQDSSDVKKIIDSFIDEMQISDFLNKFGTNTGKEKFISEIDKEMDLLVSKYKVPKKTLDPIKQKIEKKYGEMISSLVIDENNYSESRYLNGAPVGPGKYFIKSDAFDQAIKKVIKDELESVETARLIAASVQETIKEEFDDLLNEARNINKSFSKKTFDYLRYYLIDKNSSIPDDKSKDNYFFSQLFDTTQDSVQKFIDKWFVNNEDPNIYVNINYTNFIDDETKGRLELAFNVNVNGINAINSTPKIYEVKYKSDEDWDSKYIKKWMQDNLKKIDNEIIKEWKDQGYQIAEDSKNFWDVLKAQNIIDIDEIITNDPELNGKIKKEDFKLDITPKEDDKWIFKISIDKNFNKDSNDPVAQKYNNIKDDDIIDIEFQTIIYDIMQNLLTPNDLPPDSTDEYLKRTDIYSAIYQDDLQNLINSYSGKLIPLKELRQGGQLRELFKSRYTEKQIERFIQHIENLSLNNNKYSMGNTEGGIGKIDYQFINKSNYFELVIENKIGVVKTPIRIKDENLLIQKYKNPYEHFEKLLENTKINKEYALQPGQKLNNNMIWPTLKQIIPNLDSDTLPENNALYLSTFARIHELVKGDLQNASRIEYDDNITKVIFTLKNGLKYEKIISLDSLTQSEINDIKNEINNRMEEIEGYIDEINDPELKEEINDIYQNIRADIERYLNTMQTKEDVEEIRQEIIDLVDEVSRGRLEDKEELLLDEIEKRYPNGVPEDIVEKIKEFIDDKEYEYLDKTDREIENILDSGKDLYEDIRDVDIDNLLNINKILTNFEKYGIIALGGVLAFDSVAAGVVAYGISRKNKKLANNNKAKMKRAKSLIIFNLAISLLTAAGSAAMFILIFIIKGGL